MTRLLKMPKIRNISWFLGTDPKICAPLLAYKQDMNLFSPTCTQAQLA